MSRFRIPNQNRRLFQYWFYLQTCPSSEDGIITASSIAAALGLNSTQVRHDLTTVSGHGQAGRGFQSAVLKQDLCRYFDLEQKKYAIMVGHGSICEALLEESSLTRYGLQILASFDRNGNAPGSLPLDRMRQFCRIMPVQMAILSVPDADAQDVCDAVVEAGIKVIWNFTQIYLNVPSDVYVHSEYWTCHAAFLVSSLQQNKTDAG